MYAIKINCIEYLLQILRTKLNFKKVYHTNTVVQVMQKAIANPKENTYYTKNWDKSNRNRNKKAVTSRK